MKKLEEYAATSMEVMNSLYDWGGSSESQGGPNWPVNSTTFWRSAIRNGEHFLCISLRQID